MKGVSLEGVVVAVVPDWAFKALSSLVADSLSSLRVVISVS